MCIILPIYRRTKLPFSTPSIISTSLSVPQPISPIPPVFITISQSIPHRIRIATSVFLF